MEPMTLGSPVNSPNSGSGNQMHPSHSLGFASPQVQQIGTPVGSACGSQGPAGTGFLPGFLMGDHGQQGSGRVLSPTKTNRSISQAPSSVGHPSMGTPQTPIPGQKINGFLTPTTPATPGGVANLRTPSEKPGGPPTSGLFSTPKNHLLHRSMVDPATPDSRLGDASLIGFPPTPRGQMSTPMPTTPHFSFGATPDRRGYLNTINLNDTVNQSACQDGTTWVTVFGFPPSAASYILQQFSQCGTVLQHHSPANGNWMQIRYQTRTQAQSALSKSGRILGGTLMIGVTPCHDPPADAAEGNASENGHNMLDHTGTGSGLEMNSSVATVNSSIHTPSRSIRPLAKSYKTAHNEHELSMSSSSASKNDGIVGRAMEYIFGW